MSIPDPDAQHARQSRISSIRSSEGYKTATLIASAFLIVAIILGAIVVAITGDDNEDTTPAPPLSTGSATAQSTPPPATAIPDGAFGIPTTDQHGARIETPTNPVGQVLPQTAKPSPSVTITATAPIDPPAGLSWQRVNGVPIPFSTSDGPTSISAQSVPGGFTRTPQGAVLAAWQIYQRAGWGTREQTTALLQQRAVITAQSQAVADGMLGPVRDRMDDLRTQLPANLFDVPAGVKISNYDADYAHIVIALPLLPSNGGSVATAIALDVVWREGTWKWVLPSDPKTISSNVTTLSGWSQW